jgi:hypothetical protein
MKWFRDYHDLKNKLIALLYKSLHNYKIFIFFGSKSKTPSRIQSSIIYRSSVRSPPFPLAYCTTYPPHLHLTPLTLLADSDGRATWGVGLQPVACWNCGFESCRVHGCLCLVSCECCALCLCEGPIRRPRELWQLRICVTECDQLQKYSQLHDFTQSCVISVSLALRPPKSVSMYFLPSNWETEVHKPFNTINKYLRVCHLISNLRPLDKSKTSFRVP